MGFHTFDPGMADRLDDAAARYRHLSEEELLALLAPAAGEAVADLGSGTGFYTDSVAPAAGVVHAVDVQPEMHDRYRERGLPGNVRPVTADVADLPFPDDALDAAFTVDTYHEFAGEGALAEVARVLRPGGRLVVVDWTARGPGDAGPPTDQRYDLADAAGHLRAAGFRLRDAEERRETFLLRAAPAGDA